MALREIKGDLAHKNMIVSGTIVGPQRPEREMGPGLLTALMIGLLLFVFVVVMVTAPFWFLHS